MYNNLTKKNNTKTYLSILKNLELKATITVLADINIAPIAGVKRIPYAKSIPAAAGIAKILYPAPQIRF